MEKFTEAEPRKGIVDILNDRPNAVAAGLILLFTFMAWSQRFMLDDAFISFRYADHLARGHGLVWNIGEAPVEGFTNFLWVLIMAVPQAVGIDPVTFSMVLGVALFAGALAATFLLAGAVTGRPWAGIAAVVSLAGLYSFRAFATGGLETMLQALLVTTVFLLVAGMSRDREVGSRKLVTVSALAGLAFLTRMDSALLVAVPMLQAGLAVFRHAPPENRLRRLSALYIPVTLMGMSLFVFRLSYFGTLLPNTFHVKVPSGLVSTAGFVYLHNFLASYLLYPLVFLIPAALLIRRGNIPAAVRAMALTLLLWVAYLVKVGGDFMEFRFLVPAMPFLVVLLLWSVWTLTPSTALRAVFVLLLLAGSIHHQATYRSTPDNSLTESVDQLFGHLTDEGDAWVTTGIMLGEYLRPVEGKPISIALTPAGAIPYYSKLQVIDMLGLNDPWVAKNGLTSLRNATAHQRVAPISYLRDRGVHLLLGHPKTYDATMDPGAYLEDAIVRAAFMNEENIRQLSPEVRIVEIPVLKGRNVVAVYLNAHERIDRLVAGGIFRSYTVKIMDIMGESDP